MLAGELRVYRDSPIAVRLGEAHDAIAGAVGAIRGADHRDGAGVGEKLGDVLVAGQRHDYSSLRRDNRHMRFRFTSSIRRAAMPAKISASSPSPAAGGVPASEARRIRSEEHTSELQSLMLLSYAVFCCKKQNQKI